MLHVNVGGNVRGSFVHSSLPQLFLSCSTLEWRGTGT